MIVELEMHLWRQFSILKKKNPILFFFFPAKIFKFNKFQFIAPIVLCVFLKATGRLEQRAVLGKLFIRWKIAAPRGSPSWKPFCLQLRHSPVHIFPHWWGVRGHFLIFENRNVKGGGNVHGGMIRNMDNAEVWAVLLLPGHSWFHSQNIQTHLEMWR